jgi:hypothetical protein
MGERFAGSHPFLPKFNAAFTGFAVLAAIEIATAG